MSGDRDWRIGGQDDVQWIADGTDALGATITTAVPPVFAAYATVAIPSAARDEREVENAKRAHDVALLGVLRRHTNPQSWWLGYLETGVADVVFPDAPRTRLYTWPYVLVAAGPDQAEHWRTEEPQTPAASNSRSPRSRWTPWHSALPELMFPADHTWLVSTLWDDDWTCVGGSEALVADLLSERTLRTRRVTTDEDCLPPGHVRD